MPSWYMARLYGLLALAVIALSGAPGWAQSRKSTAPAWDPPQSAIVVHAGSGQIVHAEQATARRHPASLTKLMTLYLTFEALQRGQLRLNQELPVSLAASERSPTKLGLPPGGRLEVEEAILGLITRSANDAATVLAEALAGSEERFAQAMTARAQRLGMRNTVFRNASGLPDDEQITTAYDMAVLAHAMLRDFPQFYPYFSRTTFTFRGETIHTHNRLLHSAPGVDGMKTGFVRASGFNIATSALRGDTRLIAVYFGGRSAALRDQAVRAILEKSFEFYGEVRSAGADNKAGKRRNVAQSGVAAAARDSTIKPAAGEAQDPRYARRLMQSGNVGTRLANSGQPQEWTLQVGAFGKRKAAEQQALAAVKASGGASDIEIERGTEKGHVVYRALVTGFENKQDAREACDRLRKRKLACQPIGPTSVLGNPRGNG
ncbi:MAG: D-alanyl-D-alanine carboxypeptidase [Alphaproteobacteria bacterium]|nr:D-alanyl-D-alanine carboxypeptidase [Alphaproteobacteria bacterium]